jgi:hypothetical protein
MFSTITEVYERWLPTLVVGAPAMLIMLRGIHKLTVHVNSRMDELLDVTRELAKSQGLKEGRLESRLEAEQTARNLLENTNTGDTSKFP